MSNVGYATLTVTPSLRGFQRSMQQQLGGVMPAVGRQSGRNLGTAIGAGAAANTAPVAAAGQRMGQAVTGSMNTATSGAQSGFSRLQAGAVGAFSAVATGAATAGRSITSGIANGARGADSAITNLGSSIRGMAGVAAAATAAMGFANITGDIMEVASGAQHTEAVLEGLYATAGHGASEASRMMDLLNDNFSRSGIEMQAFQQGASDLAYLGLTAQETADILGFMESTIAANGGSAAELGRVTQALASAQNAGRASAAELNQISQAGVPIYDMLADSMDITNSEIRDLTGSGELLVEDVLDALQSRGGTWAQGLIDGAETADRTWASAWSSMRNTFVNGMANQVVPLLDNLAPSVHRMNDAIGDAMESLPQRLSSVKAAMDNAGVTDALRTIMDAARSLAQGILPVFSGVAQGVGVALGAMVLALEPVAGLLASFGEWLQQNSDTVRTFGQVLGGLIAVVLAFKAAIAIGGAIAALANPVGLVVTAIAALAAGLHYAWQNSETFRDIVTSVWEFVQGAAESVVDWFMSTAWPTLQQVWDRITDGASAAGEFFADVWDSVGEIFGQVMELFSELWDSHGEGVIARIQAALTVLSGAWTATWTALGGILSGVWTAIQGIISGALEVISGILDVFLGLLQGDWERVWEGIKGIVSGGWTAITGLFEGAVEAIGGILSGLWELITSIWEAIYDWLIGNSLIPDLVNGIVEWFQSLTEWIGDTLSAVWNVITTVWNAIRDAVSTVVNAIYSVVSSVWNTIRSVTETVMNVIRSVISTVWNAIRAAVQGDVSGVQNIISNAWTAVRTLTTAAWNAIRSAVSTAASNLLSTVSRIPGRIFNVFSNIGNSMRTIGRNIITGIINGVTSAASGLYNRLRNVASNALSSAKEALGIASPSRAFRDEVGAEVVAGLLQGLADGERVVENQMDALVAHRPQPPQQRNLMGELASHGDASSRQQAAMMGRLVRAMENGDGGDIVVKVDSQEIARATRRGEHRLSRR